MIPDGFPSALAVGSSLALRVFIPAIELDGSFQVPGKDRHRTRVVASVGKKPYVQTYSTEKMRVWEAHAGSTALAQLRAVDVKGDPSQFTLPLQEMRVLMGIRFNMRKPPSYGPSVVHHTKKPDVDNLAKAILDALVTHKVLGNDSCITDLTLSKRYAEPGHPEGVEVEMTCLPC